MSEGGALDADAMFKVLLPRVGPAAPARKK